MNSLCSCLTNYRLCVWTTGGCSCVVTEAKQLVCDRIAYIQPRAAMRDCRLTRWRSKKTSAGLRDKSSSKDLGGCIIDGGDWKQQRHAHIILPLLLSLLFSVPGMSRWGSSSEGWFTLGSSGCQQEYSCVQDGHETKKIVTETLCNTMLWRQKQELCVTHCHTWQTERNLFCPNC